MLLLHTSGSLWVDVIGIQGARTEPFVRWLPGSARTELGLLPHALSTLDVFAGGRLAHLFVSLSAGTPPSGESAQAAVGLAALWYWAASRRGIPCARPQGGERCPRNILAATGTIVEQPGSDGLFHYVVGEVADIDAKVAALAEWAEGDAHIDLLVPRAQQADAERALQAHFDCRPSAVPHTWRLGRGRRLRLHPVGDLEHLQDVVELVLAESRSMAAELEVGTVLEGRFVLDDLVGEGGAGSVWRATDNDTGRDVAIKVLHPHIARDPERLGAFFRGARHMRRLDMGVAEIVHSPGGHGPHRYIAMTYLPNGSLHDAVVVDHTAGGMDLVLGTVEPLAAAHRVGVVHGDVKPQNILLDDNQRPVLVDFDLSRVLGNGSNTTRSLGSLAYCAPEVLTSGADAASPASDVYSLAMTALFVLHGSDLPVAALRTPQDFLEEVEAPSPVRWALAKALSIDPDDRPRDAGELGQTLRDAMAQGDVGPGYRGPSSRLARRGPFRVLAVLAALAAVGAVWGWVASGRAIEEREQARASESRHALIEHAWRLAAAQPAQALALLRSADAIDAEAAASLLRQGAASKVIEVPEFVMDVDVASDGTIGVGLIGGLLLALDGDTGKERWRVQTPLERAKVVRFMAGSLGAWAPDARLRGFHDDPAVFYDQATGEATNLLPVRGSPMSVYFGEGQALSMANNVALFWDTKSLLPVRMVRRVRDVGMSVSPDGRHVLMFGAERTEVHDAHGVAWEGQPIVLPMKGRLEWSKDGTRFALGSDHDVVVYDLDTLTEVARFDVPCHRRMYLDAHGTQMVCGGPGTDMALIDVADFQVRELEGHTSRLSVVAWLDGAVATGEFDGGLHLWDTHTGRLIATLDGHTDLIGAVVAADPRTLVTGAQDKTVRIWDLTTVWPEHEIVVPDWEGAIAVNGDHVVWRASDGLVRADGAVLGTATASDEITWSTDGEHVVRAGEESVLWGLDGTEVQLGGKYRHLAANLLDGEVHLIADQHEYGKESEDLVIGVLGEKLHGVTRNTEVLVLSLAWAGPDLALVFPYKGDVMAYSTDGTPRSRLAGFTEGVTDYQLIGGKLLAGSWSPRTRVWDLATGALGVEYLGHTEDVVAVDQVGDWVASGSWDGTARLWHADGTPIHTLHHGDVNVVDVALSPDGALLATLSGDRITRYWSTATGALLGIEPASHAGALYWTTSGLLTLEADNTARRWQPASTPITDALGDRTNLRVCPDGRVVPVVPWPEPATTAAPASACALRAAGDAPTH